MVRYQGEDILFNLELNKIAPDSVVDWNEFSKIIVYFYTQNSHIAKYSTDSETGYLPLNRVDAAIIGGKIGRDDTKLMSGPLYMDIMAVAPNDVVNIKSISTGVTIANSQIKQEIS
jgi:hypothetical protein